MDRNPFAHLHLDLGVFRIVREIVPFPFVILVVAQLFGSVGVNNVPVSLGSNPVILVAKNGQRRSVP